MAPSRNLSPTLEQITALAARRGFVYQTSAIYGGLSASYDYGHYGTQLKRNVKDAWFDSMLRDQDGIVALDSAIIQHPQTWRSSGHVALFNDPVQQCSGCGSRLRADHVAEGREPCRAKPSVCAGQGPKCELGPVTQFNSMFETQVGSADGGQTVYLRPETAQGIFTSFDAVLKSSRVKVPFGIAQIGKSFRNEITARQFIFRTREFEQAEMEWFCHPDEAFEWYKQWRDIRLAWYAELGIRPESLRLREHGADERAHYSVATSDVEFLFPWGWDEVEGIAHRGDYDLTQHLNNSNFGVVDKATGERHAYRDQEGRVYTPHVIEPAMGVDRFTLAALCDAYDEDDLGDSHRTVLRLSPRLAPVKVAVLPLLRKNSHPEFARSIYQSLRKKFVCEYDDGGHIGKRYRRQDEIGTPYCITVDHQSLQDSTVTVRERDTLQQVRVSTDKLAAFFADKL